MVRGDGNYAPYEMQQGNKLRGFHIELIETVANELGIMVRFESTKGNELSFAYSGLVVLTDRKSEFNFNGKALTHLKHFKFGHNLGFIYGDYFDKAQLNKFPFNSNEQLFNMLRIKRIDIAMMNAGEFSHRLSVNDKTIKKLTMLDKKVAIASYIGQSHDDI